MKEAYVISTGEIVGSKTAGARRMMTISKALAEGGVKVFLCSYQNINTSPVLFSEIHPGVYYLYSNGNKTMKPHLAAFLTSLYGFIRKRDSAKVIYLYPTVYVCNDFMYLLYFKVLKRMKLFCDINELRSTNVYALYPSEGMIRRLGLRLKSAYDFIAYRLSEFQIPFYDGIIVISTSLERYFLKCTRKLVRIPLLCDMSFTHEKLPALYYDKAIFRICFAGSINCRKEGFEVFFNALKMVSRLHRVELYLYGILTELDRKELQRLTSEFSLEDQVFYVGNLEPDKLINEYAAYHLLAVPRQLIPQTKYGFSSKLCEYIISGVPVLLTDVSDNAMYFEDGYNCFMVSPGSPGAMSDKLLEIIDKYNTVAVKIADNAFETAKNFFDFKLFSPVLIDFLFAKKDTKST